MESEEIDDRKRSAQDGPTGSAGDGSPLKKKRKEKGKKIDKILKASEKAKEELKSASIGKYTRHFFVIASS